MISFRVTPDIDQRVTDLAQYHGRQRADELRLAWAIYDTRATLAYLDTPQGEQEVRSGGGDPAVERRKVAQELRELEAAAFRPAPTPSFPLPSMN